MQGTISYSALGPRERNIGGRIFCLRIFAQIIFILSVMACVTAQAADLRMGTGAKDGSYYDFGVRFKSLLQQTNHNGPQLTLKATQGSYDNILLMKSGQLDVAIIQNDIGNYVYNGYHDYSPWRGFSAGLPLFYEYVHVLIRADSPIRTFRGLRGKSISIGALDSGGYHNALDLLEALGFESGIDYNEVHLTTTQGIQELLVGKVDAVIFTAAAVPTLPEPDASKLVHLSLPDRIIGNLTAKFPYYEHRQIPQRMAGEASSIQTVSVISYLAFGPTISNRDAAALVTTLLKNWPKLRRQKLPYELVDINQEIKKTPFDWHPAATAAFEKQGLLRVDYSIYYISAIILAIIFIVYWARKKCAEYDRLGNFYTGQGAVWHRILIFVDKFSLFFLLAALNVVCVMTLVYIARVFEAQYASEYNISDEFLSMTYMQSLLWTFTLMGAAQTGGIFPLSIGGKIAASLLPLLGLSTVAAYMFASADRIRLSRAARRRGTLIRSVKNHVLVCGWEEGAEHLVYSLTSTEAPNQKQLVVLADLPGDMPLVGHRFNPSYVQYCRGTATNHADLERARVRDAATAVILDGDRSSTGVFSALALRYFRDRKLPTTPATQKRSWYHSLVELLAQKRLAHKPLFIIAQATNNSDAIRFKDIRVDAIHYSARLFDRIFAQCCANEGILDFVLDAITYDEHSELYSEPLADYSRYLPIGIRDSHSLLMMELRKALLTQGVNLVASVSASDTIDIVSDSELGFRAFLSQDERNAPVLKSDTLLYFANDEIDLERALRHLRSTLKRLAKSRYRSGPSQGSCELRRPAKRRVLLIGEQSQCKKIAEEFATIPWIEVLTVELPSPAAKTNGLSSAQIEAIRGMLPLYSVGIMTQGDETTAEMADSSTVLLAEQIYDEVFSYDDTRPHFVAELSCTKNKSLFEYAGIDVVLPRNIVDERFLSKLVFSRGLATQFLVSLLETHDGKYLVSMRVEKRDGACDKMFIDLAVSTPPGWQLLGWLPGSKESPVTQLRNNEGDFGWHFVTCPKGDFSRRKIAAGDLLIYFFDVAVAN